LNCATGAISSFKSFYSLYFKLIDLIEDIAQKERAKENLEKTNNSLISNENIVSHNPVVTTITCGSACNIKCKFCYNCNMDYYPEAQDILRIIDQIHETLIEATITGGEPIVTKAGRALLQEFASGKYKFFVQLFTNAQYADFSLYRPVNFRQITISSDGATKKVYEYVRVGGKFEDLISNVKKFIELKKDKPFMDVLLNFTVTSDNYIDIPEAVKLYEDMELKLSFQAVIIEKDDPQNFSERPELYDDVLKKIEEGIKLSSQDRTKKALIRLKNHVYRKMEEKRNEEMNEAFAELGVKPKNKKLFSFKNCMSHIKNKLFPQKDL